MIDDALKTKLSGEIAPTTWRDLRPHAARDKVILVAPPAALVDAAVALAMDDAERVADWTRGGALARPTREQLTAWERTHDKPFDCVIVSPFVLVRER